MKKFDYWLSEEWSTSQDYLGFIVSENLETAKRIIGAMEYEEAGEIDYDHFRIVEVGETDMDAGAYDEYGNMELRGEWEDPLPGEEGWEEEEY